MTEDVKLASDNDTKIISPISWIILFGYIVLTLLTYLLIQNFGFARDLFDQTEIIIKINAVWFSIGIVFYGIYALNRNRKRAKLSNLNINLDTQFLIVIAFLFFGLKQVIDLALFLQDSTNPIFIAAMENSGKVLEFGGFMSGLFSIYFGRKRR